MRQHSAFLSVAIAAASGVAAQTLDDICTVENIQSILPATDFVAGIAPNVDSVVVNIETNYTAAPQGALLGGSGYEFCNVTFSYTHTGLGDNVNVWYFLPPPDQWQGRYLATGGSGFAITSGASGLSAGLVHGAASGTTDGGFGGFSGTVTNVVLANNGTLNWEYVVNFAYLSIHEATLLGKELTANFYGTDAAYAYYAGCSEGGRDGWSQAQRFGEDFDGLTIGAPAMRQAFQQPTHIYSNLVEVVEGYAPSTCELNVIEADLLAACDGLDGQVDGVIARSDLCKIHFKASDSIGHAYSCAASGGGFGMGRRQMGGGGSSAPATNGTVSAAAAAVAQKIIDGVFDDEGRQMWLTFQPGAGFSDASATYNATSGEYSADINSGIGALYVNYFLDEVPGSSLDISDWTYNTLRKIFLAGMQKFASTLQTTWPDLEELHNHGAKVLHWHGEADNSVPTGSSVWYQKSVRETMYPNLGFNESFAELDDWYKLFLIPGAGHCASSATNGTFPTDMLGNLIDWVEGGRNIEQLNATVVGGPLKGTRQDVCKFPLRPLFTSNSTLPSCVYDQASIDAWFPTLDSFSFPIY